MGTHEGKTALITGYTGQDGTFLTKHLLEMGYKVIGMVRRVSTEPPRRVRGKFDFSAALKDGQLVLEEGDLLSRASIDRLVVKYHPDEIYNLAAQSHVGQSFTQPELTIATILEGTINLITALENLHKGKWRMYQASTSEMFGDVPKIMFDSIPEEHRKGINEKYRFNPNSPYAIAKTAAHQYCVMKRNQGHFISCGILFNHESEIRGGDFVTQKIARGVVNWLSTGEPIHLGNLDSARDWGYAGDYVRAMHYMLQHNTPEDFVVATGEHHTVREFVSLAFSCFGYNVEWYGEGEKEAGRINKSRDCVVVDRQFYRPNDVNFLVGDASKALDVLGWAPAQKFDAVVKIMVGAAKEE
jgi:GDPmannose 4,6-dehydratase